jgi:hypothetical protein
MAPLLTKKRKKKKKDFSTFFSAPPSLAKGPLFILFSNEAFPNQSPKAGIFLCPEVYLLSDSDYGELETPKFSMSKTRLFRGVISNLFHG